MRRIVLLASLLTSTSTSLLPGVAEAFPAHLRRVEQRFKIRGRANDTCNLCHTAGGGSPRNPFGTAFQIAGANDVALATIEAEDSDRDGVSNLRELLAGAFPGDPSSTSTPEELARTPERPGEAVAPADDAVPDVDESAGEFALVVPDEALGEGAPTAGDTPSLSYTIGGALDLRLVVPTRDRGNPARTFDAFVHVAEVVLQTTIGQRITLLGELLLPLNADLPIEEQFLGNDHGFFYATIADVPYPTASLWLGRYRIPYGVDAVLDGASNPLPTPVYRSIGRIADLAIMVKGYLGAFEYSLAATDGVGILPASEDDAAAEAELLEDWPVFGRLAVDLHTLLPGLHAGLSGYYGRAFREPDVGLGHAHGLTTSGVLARKWRAAGSAWYAAGPLAVHVEGEVGQDELEAGDLAAFREETGLAGFEAFETVALFGRVTVRPFARLDVTGQAHYYHPNWHGDGHQGHSEEELSVGGALTYGFIDQVRGRVAWVGYFLDDADRVDVATTQLLLEF